MTSFYMCLIRSILTSLMILSFIIFPVKTYHRMFLCPIIHRTHQMPVCHCIMVRTHLYMKIHSIFHLSFLKMLRVNILVTHQPLYMIHQIMSIPVNISNFLLMVFVIFSLLQLITMLIHSLLILLIHWSPMIYLLMKWKPLKLLRHFILC